MIKTFKVLNEAHGNVIPDEFNELESMVLEGTKTIYVTKIFIS